MTYAYVTEYFIAWYSGSPFERGTFLDRAIGQYAPLFWITVVCNCVIPLSLFFKKVRTHVGLLFVISLLVNVGMWLERYVIIVSSLSHDYNPSVWPELYTPTWVETAITAGSFAWFFLLFLLFVKNFPAVSMTEVKERAAEQPS